MGKVVNTLFSGLNTVDLHYFIDKPFKVNTKIKALRNEVVAGGPATNAAISCAFLGAETTLITPVGNHQFSGLIKNDILNYEINIIDPIEKIDSEPVLSSIITNELDGGRTIFYKSPELTNRPVFKYPELLTDGKFAIALFDGFYPEWNIVLAEKLKSAGITTVFDGGSWKPSAEAILPFIDIAVCSNDFQPPGTKSKKDVVNCLLDFGIKKIAFTRGEKPVLVYENNKKKEIQVPKIKAIDTLGAGDFFHGAFCYYYAFQPNFENALKNAASIASFSCQYPGTRSWMNNYKNKLITNRENY